MTPPLARFTPSSETLRVRAGSSAVVLHLARGARATEVLVVGLEVRGRQGVSLVLPLGAARQLVSHLRRLLDAAGEPVEPAADEGWTTVSRRAGRGRTAP